MLSTRIKLELSITARQRIPPANLTTLLKTDHPRLRFSILMLRFRQVATSVTYFATLTHNLLIEWRNMN